eukprot:3666950-Rhodomonas_salina.2
MSGSQGLNRGSSGPFDRGGGKLEMRQTGGNTHHGPKAEDKVERGCLSTAAASTPSPCPSSSRAECAEHTTTRLGIEDGRGGRGEGGSQTGLQHTVGRRQGEGRRHSTATVRGTANQPPGNAEQSMQLLPSVSSQLPAQLPQQERRPAALAWVTTHCSHKVLWHSPSPGLLRHQTTSPPVPSSLKPPQQPQSISPVSSRALAPPTVWMQANVCSSSSGCAGVSARSMVEGKNAGSWLRSEAER